MRFDLEQPADDGTPIRVHLEAVEERTGRRPERLNIPPVPYCFERCMQLWGELHGGRRYGDSGPQGLSWTDFDAYCRMTGEVLDDNDMYVLNVIERQYFASLAAVQTRKAKKNAQ